MVQAEDICKLLKDYALWLAAKAAGKLLAYLLADQPSLVRSMVVRPRTANWRAGKLFSLVSPAVHGRSPGGLPIGSNTGRIRAAQPGWVRRRYAVPDAVMDIEDAVVRQYTSLRFGIPADVRAITTANPSMLLLLFFFAATLNGCLPVRRTCVDINRCVGRAR